MYIYCRWFDESIHIFSQICRTKQFYLYSRLHTVPVHSAQLCTRDIHINTHQSIYFYSFICISRNHNHCRQEFLIIWYYFSRFNSKLVRRLASFSFIIRNCLSLAVTFYTPCVAVNTIAGIPYWISLMTMTLLTIVFTFTVSPMNPQKWRTE